jgi:hypothetical protein
VQKERDEQVASEKEEEAFLRALTPEQRLARTVRPNTAQFCRFVSKIEPEKLMPGQTGKIVLAAMLTGQAVLPSPLPIEMLGSRRQGLVELSELLVYPADSASLAPGYQGREVYDNYAVMEIPITMSPTAEIGRKQPVAVDLRFDIYDGVSAQAIGRFVERVSAEVEVGKVTDPVVASGGGSDSPAAQGPTKEKERVVTPRPATNGRSDAPAVKAREPVPAPASGDPSEAPLSAEDSRDWSELSDSGSGVPLPVWIGGGVVLLALVLMLAKRR